MKIAGIYPFEEMQDKKVQQIFGEPIGLELVLASAKQEGHETKLFLPITESCNGIQKKSTDELCEEIVSFKPDVAAFSFYSCQFDFGKKIAQQLKEKLPELTIVAGNRHATTNAQELDYPFDFYVLGEGEKTFVELLHELGNGNNFEKVNGLAFKLDGKLVITQQRSLEKNLDNIPNAARDPLLLKQFYSGLGFPAASKKPKIAIVEYSRGCFGFCKFCDNSLVWQRCVRFRSTEKTVKEMTELKKQGIEIFYFMDLNFTADKKKALEFCDAIKDSKQEFNWYCMSNIDTAKPKLLKALKEAGCFKINYGVESTNNESLQLMKKGLQKNKILQQENCLKVLKKTQATGLMSGGYYIIGFPWESKQTILHDAKPLAKYAIHCLNVGIATPHPGTAWRSEFKKEELINDWKKYDRRHLCYKHKYLDEKTLQELQEKICTDFFNSEDYLQNVRELVSIEPKFKQSFQDFFELMNIKRGI